MAGENDLELRITASAQQAIAEVEKLDAASTKGLTSLTRQATAAGVALDKMETEIRQANAAGVKLSEDQQKAFATLRTSYDSAIQKAGQFRAAQDDVRKATAAASASIDGQARPITNTGDLFERMGGKIGKIGGPLVAITATFTAFYDITTRLRDKVNEFTDGALDKLIQKLIRLNPLAQLLAKLLGVDLKDAADAASFSAKELGNSLEGQAHFAEEAAKANKKNAEAIKEQKDPLDDFRKSSDQSVESTRKLGKAAEEELPKVADGSKAAAEEARGLAKALKDAADTAQKAHADAAAREGAAAGNLEDIKKRRQELAGKDVLSPEEINEQGDLVGKQAQAEQELTKAHGETTAKAIELDKANQGLTRSFDALGNAASSAGDIFGTALQGIETFLPGIARGSEDLDAGAQAFTIYGNAAENAADATSGIAESLANIGDRLQTVADHGSQSAEDLDDLGDAAGEAAENLDDLDKKGGDAAATMEELGDKSKEGADKAHEGFEVLKSDLKELAALVREYKAEVASLG